MTWCVCHLTVRGPASFFILRRMDTNIPQAHRTSTCMLCVNINTGLKHSFSISSLAALRTLSPFPSVERPPHERDAATPRIYRSPPGSKNTAAGPRSGSPPKKGRNRAGESPARHSKEGEAFGIAYLSLSCSAL